MVLPLVAIIVLAVLWSVYWFAALAIAKNEFARERARQAERGLTLSCEAESWSGYPFRFEYECLLPQVADDRGGSGTTKNLRAVAMAYKPWHVLLFLEGPTDLSLSRQGNLTIRHDPARASLLVEGQRAGQLTIEASNLDAGGLLTAGTILFSARTAGAHQFDYAINSETLAVNPPGMAPIAADQFESQGTLTADETLVITSALLQQGTLQLTAAGQVALDEHRRPYGQITLKTNDAAALMHVFGSMQLFTEQQGTALSALLTVAGNQVTLTANNGELYAGPLKIADLQPLP